jgi:hypothetical protein
MEYAKTGNLTIAEQFFGHATGICSFDPLAFNEIGVVRYLQQDYQEAANAFEQVAHTYTLYTFAVVHPSMAFALKKHVF